MHRIIDKDDEENGDEADVPNVLNDNNVGELPIQAGSDHPSTEEE